MRRGARGAERGTGATGAKGTFATDPRGGIYQAFQNTFDRSKDPFSSLTDYCTSHTAAASRKATDAAGADTITIVNLRTKLEQLEAIGFSLPLGNNNEMYRVFTQYINDKCGGIRGRKIDFQIVEVNSQSQTLDADRRAACIKATEDLKAPIVLNSTGFAGTPWINARQNAQANRINNGVVSGRLTPTENAKLLHFTEGGPYYEATRNVDFADEWFDAFAYANSSGDSDVWALADAAKKAK